MSLLRLNVGCGRHVLPGYTNVDIVASPKAKRPPEILADVRDIPLPASCASELMAIHVFEHFYRWEVNALLNEWYRLLAPNGILVLELPNLIKCCQNVVTMLKAGKDPDQMGMWGLYGDPTEKNVYMCHRWGWSPAALTATLMAHGFVDIHEERTQWHPTGRDNRDMRIVARKP